MQEPLEVQDWESDEDEDVPAPPLVMPGSPGRTEFFNLLFQDHKVGPEEPAEEPVEESVAKPGMMWDDWDDDETPVAIAAQKAKNPWAAGSFWDDWDEESVDITVNGASSETIPVVHV